MKFHSKGSFEIGDIDSFKKMLADTIKHQAFFSQLAEKNVRHNDHYYSYYPLKDVGKSDCSDK